MGDRHAACDVFELPHIARPVVAGEACDQPGGWPRTVGVGRLIEAVGGTEARQLPTQKMDQQASEVAAPVTQGGQADVIGGQAVEKGPAEGAAFDSRFEIGVGGGDHPHVGAPGLGAPQGLDLAIL